MITEPYCINRIVFFACSSMWLEKRGGANIRQHPTFKNQRIAIHIMQYNKLRTQNHNNNNILFISNADFHDFTARVNKHSHFNTFLNYHWKSVWFLWCCFVLLPGFICEFVCDQRILFINEIEKITKSKAYFCYHFCISHI